MGGRWPYICCFVGSYFQDLFNIARSILLQLPSSFFSIRFVSVQIVPDSCLEKIAFFLLNRSDVHITDHLSITVDGFDCGLKARSSRYHAWTIMDKVFAGDIAFLVNTPAQTEPLLHNMEQATGGIGLNLNANKTEFTYFNQIGDMVALWN